MKKLFLNKNKRFLTSGTLVLVILGLAAGICLKGTPMSFAQQAGIASHPLCNHAGGSIFGILNSNATCHKLSSLPNVNKKMLLSNSNPTGQFQAYFKYTNSASKPNVISNSNSIPSPVSSPTPKVTSNLSPNRCFTPSSNYQAGQNEQNYQYGQVQTLSPDTVTQAAQAVFNQINSARAQAHLPTLQCSIQLVKSAHKHNLAMQFANQMSHQLPNEPDLGTRISQMGVKWLSVGENVGYSTDYLHPTSTATGLDQEMLDERTSDIGHRLNILSKDFTTVGIDVLIDTTNYTIWLTEDFAHPA